MKGKLKKRVTIISAGILAFAIIFFLLRGPYLSNSIKRIIIPVLENTTGERVIINKAVINLFPFYLQARGVKLFDKDGNRLLRINKTRVYLDLIVLLSKEIRIRKLTIEEPDLQADEEDIRRIIEHIKQNVSDDRDKEKRFSLMNIVLTDGEIDIKSTKGLTLSGSGIFFDMATRHDVTARVLIKEIMVNSPVFPEIPGTIEGKLKIKDDRIEITGMNITSSGSTLSATGEVRLPDKDQKMEGKFTGKAEIYEQTIHRFLGVKTEKDGVMSFKGSVQMTMDNETNRPLFTVDLKTDSRFYLETLMEILKVEENVTGKLTLKGKITGTFPELSGSGKIKLENAVLGGFQLNKVEGDANYVNQKFVLSSFKAGTYDGRMEGTASLTLPDADYAVDAKFSNVSSPSFFKFIKWEPPFPAGELSGDLHLLHIHGKDLEIKAGVNYVNTSGDQGNVLDRLRTAKGSLHLKEGILKLNKYIFSTSLSNLSLDGSIDFNNHFMRLDLLLDSKGISDLTAPYYTRLLAPAVFKGKAEGPVKDPEISGRIDTGSGSVHGVKFTKASADLVYKIRSLTVPRLNITDGRSSYEASGLIEFKDAQELFSFKGPFYRGKATLKDADLKLFVNSVYQDIPVSGLMSGFLSFEGEPKNYNGKSELILKDGVAYGQQFDKVAVKTSIQPKEIEFQAVTAQRGDTVLEAKGKLYFDQRFNFTVASRKAILSDFNILHRLPVSGDVRLDINGSGTFGKPEIKFNANILESTFKDLKTGKGEIRGLLKDRELLARGSFVNGLVTADAKAVFSEKTKWNIDIDINKGSYDFLLAGFLKEVPEDISLSMEGKIRVAGDDKNVSLSSRFGYLNCSLYGYNLQNTDDIVMDFADRRLVIRSFLLSGDNAKLSAKGTTKLDEQMDVTLKGDLDITPLKALSDKLASVKGRGDFTINIAGPWDRPDIIGEINIKDVAVSMTEYPYKVGPLHGTIFLKKDRFTFDSIETNFGGGNVVVSGVGYLKGISLKRVYISSRFSGITVKPMEKVSATVDGRLFYERSDKGSALSGNLDIKKAKYEKNVEWTKWLVNLREINRDTVRYPAFLKETEFNVYISGNENIIIDNNIAKTPVRIEVTLRGNIARLGLLGRIEASEGSVFFRSNEFNILEGSNVDFIDPGRIVPVFHILAETYTGDYYIKLNLDGTMEKFTIALFSDPPLSEMEILSLLTFGQAKKDSRGIEGGIAAQEAASILTGGIQDVVQERFKSITGFERFLVEPHTTSTGAIGPKVTIGKRLFEDKLFVIYSTSVGTTEENIIKLEYRVDRNISLIGVRDERGSVGGDLKYRFEFR